jgi:hypothetical protein
MFIDVALRNKFTSGMLELALVVSVVVIYLIRRRVQNFYFASRSFTHKLDTSPKHCFPIFSIRLPASMMEIVK